MKLPFIDWELKRIVKEQPAPQVRRRKAIKRAKRKTWPCGMAKTAFNTKTFANGRQVCLYHYNKSLEQKRIQRAAAKGGQK